MRLYLVLGGLLLFIVCWRFYRELKANQGQENGPLEESATGAPLQPDLSELDNNNDENFLLQAENTPPSVPPSEESINASPAEVVPENLETENNFFPEIPPEVLTVEGNPVEETSPNIAISQNIIDR